MRTFLEEIAEEYATIERYSPRGYWGARRSIPRASRRRTIYTRGVGFYHGSGAPPPEDRGSGGFRETVAIILVVFKLLAVPVGILIGVLLGLVLLFYAFVFSPILGVALLAGGVAALVGRGIWEAKHPPDLR
jgi:hypothetical protein